MNLFRWIKGNGEPVPLAGCLAEIAIILEDIRSKRIDRDGAVKRFARLNRKRIKCSACSAEYLLGEATSIRKDERSMLYVYTCPGCRKEDAVGITHGQ